MTTSTITARDITEMMTAVDLEFEATGSVNNTLSLCLPSLDRLEERAVTEPFLTNFQTTFGPISETKTALQSGVETISCEFVNWNKDKVFD